MVACERGKRGLCVLVDERGPADRISVLHERRDYIPERRSPPQDCMALRGTGTEDILSSRV